MRKGTQLTLEEPNGVSEPLSCLPKALEQHCEVSLAPFCTHLPRETGSVPCLPCTETALCQQDSSTYLQNPCKLSSGLSLVAVCDKNHLLQSLEKHHLSLHFVPQH